jgi:hypothetical protein
MSNKKSYRIEKTLYKDQMIVIHIQKDKAILSITFAENISMDEKEEIILKIKNALNS